MYKYYFVYLIVTKKEENRTDVYIYIFTFEFEYESTTPNTPKNILYYTEELRVLFLLL